jgi:hypothetical protein
MSIKIEMHLHSKESSPCAKTDIKSALKAFKENGYGAVVITDHFYHWILKDLKTWKEVVDKFLLGYRLALEEGEKLGLKVFLGMEIRFPQNYNDYLVYGIDEEFIYEHEYIYNTSLEEFYELVKDKYVVVQAHPFRWSNTLYDTKYLHGVEILNTNPNNECNNDLAYNAWTDTNLVSTCGCDFHSLDCITNSHYMTLNRMPSNNKELVEILKNKEYEIK